MNIFKTSILLLFSLLFVACNGSQSKQTDRVQGEVAQVFKKEQQVEKKQVINLTQVHDAKSYSLSYPEGWRAMELNQTAELVLLNEVKSTPGFKRNFSVQVTNREGATLAMMIDKYTKEITSIQKTAKIIESKTMERDGVDYHQIIFTADSFGGTKNINHYWVKDGMGIFLSYTDSIESFDNSTELINSVLGSFKIK